MNSVRSLVRNGVPENPTVPEVLLGGLLHWRNWVVFVIAVIGSALTVYLGGNSVGFAGGALTVFAIMEWNERGESA